MNRDAFLEMLREELQGAPLMEVNDIIADYREYFRDAIAAGRDEASIAKALGKPRDLAAALLRAETPSFRQTNASRSRGQRVAAVVALIFLNLTVAIPVFTAACVTMVGLFVGAIFLLLAGLAAIGTSVPGNEYSGFVKLDVFGSPVTDPAIVAVAGVMLVLTSFIWLRVNGWLGKRLGCEIRRYVRFNQRFVDGAD